MKDFNHAYETKAEAKAVATALEHLGLYDAVLILEFPMGASSGYNWLVTTKEAK